MSIISVKFDVYFKRELGTLFKSNEVDLDGLEANVNLDLDLVESMKINYLINGNKLTDDITIKDIENRLILIPFKSEVRVAETKIEFEIQANMKNGDVKVSQTYTYDVEMGIGEGVQVGTGGSTDGHSHNNLSTLHKITEAKIKAWDAKSDFSGSYNDLTNKPTIPTVDVTKSYVDGEVSKKADRAHSHSEYATPSYVQEKIAEASLSGGEVDLSAYATKAELNTKADKSHTHNELHSHSNKTVLDGITSSKVNEWDNKSTFNGDYNSLTNKPVIPSTEGLATESYVQAKIAEASLSGGEVDLSGYATEEYVNIKVAENTDKITVLSDKVDELKQNCGSSIAIKDIFANNELPRVYMTSDRLGLLATKTDPEAICECEIKINNQTIRCYATGKVQGTSSASYPGKNFTFKFYSDVECASKQKIDVGWGEQYKYCFKKNWVDTTHTRNLAGARIAYDMVESRPSSDFKTNLQKAPRNGLVDGFPCKLYINGEFWGLYTWNIPKDTWQFGMDSNNHNHVVLCAEKNTDGNANTINSCQFKTLWTNGDGGDWSVEAGEYSNSVRDSLNRCIQFVMSSSDSEFYNNINDYFDLDSLLDYYCFSYLCVHLDGLAKNMLLATYDGRIWGASLYDMDSTFGAHWDGTSFVSPTYQCPSEYQEQFSLLWQRVEKCFGKELYARYRELRKGALSLGNIVTHVEEIYDLIPDRVLADDKDKWIGMPSQTSNTITRFRNYMRDRAIYVDEKFQEFNLEKIPATGIVLSQSALTFTDQNTQTLIATPSPSDTTDQITWSVSPSGIASVNNGVVTPIANGDCVITVTCGIYSVTCNVNVALPLEEPTTGLVYELPMETTFNGTSDFVDTGVELFDTDKDFSILIDFTGGMDDIGISGGGKAVIHCLHETSPWNGVVLDGNHTKSFRVASGSEQTFLLDSDGARLPYYSRKNQKYIIVKEKGNNILKIYNYYYGQAQTFASSGVLNTFNQNLLLGCIQTIDGTKERFWAGIIHRCKVWYKALSESEVDSEFNL